MECLSNLPVVPMHPAVSLRSNCVAWSSQSPLFQEFHQSITGLWQTDKYSLKCRMWIERARITSTKLLKNCRLRSSRLMPPPSRKCNGTCCKLVRDHQGSGCTSMEYGQVDSLRTCPFLGCLAHGAAAFYGLHLLLKLLLHLWNLDCRTSWGFLFNASLPNLMSKLVSCGSTLTTCTQTHKRGCFGKIPQPLHLCCLWEIQALLSFPLQSVAILPQRNQQLK